jgi:hypothetical protein
VYENGADHAQNRGGLMIDWDSDRHRKRDTDPLQSPAWRRFRAAILAERPGGEWPVEDTSPAAQYQWPTYARTDPGGVRTDLPVPHLTDERLGHEHPDDVQVLCERHHAIASRWRCALCSGDRRELEDQIAAAWWADVRPGMSSWAGTVEEASNGFGTDCDHGEYVLGKDD